MQRGESQVGAAQVSPAHRAVLAREPVPKRLFDLALAGAGLLASAPLWLLIALAVKLDDGGPVFYAQERAGRNGARFKSLKFRSMVPDADERFGPLQAAA